MSKEDSRLSMEDSRLSKKDSRASKEDSRLSKHLSPSTPIDIPKRKMKPQWIENRGWIKYQKMHG